MQDMLTPEEIENTSFPDGQFGYDRLHVDAFLRTVAAQIRRLQRDLELALERSEAPYRAAGKEIGDLIHKAKQRAEELVNDAEDSAHRIVTSARKEAEERAEQTVAAEQEARRTGDRILSEARAEAEALVERARQIKSRVEAESRIALQEVERDARRLKQEAKNEADAARSVAERQRVETAAQLERRIRALREAESALRQRVATLKAHHDSVVADAGVDDGIDAGAPEPKTT